MNYLLDTCVISDFFKKVPATTAHFQNLSPNQIHVSTVTVMEIEYGLKLNPEREKNIRPLWQSLLTLIQVVRYCEQCAEASAKLRAKLKKSGQPIGPYDILIAGSALANDMIVVTSNVCEFSRMPEIIYEDWRVT